MSSKELNKGATEAYSMFYRYLAQHRNILARGKRLDFTSDHWHQSEVRVDETDVCQVICGGGSAVTVVTTESR